ncbi:MAG: hypothetical protein JWM59_3937 [Verrucomicrobiales bacterium]|nr:hypothetical protein [Verrucomicrobiales bacterium]
MKTTLRLLCLPLSAVSLPLSVSAAPFTARPVPGGLAAAALHTESGYLYCTQEPVAADFLGNGRRQWYAGGATISRFPESGTITLPSYTLPQWTPATIQPIAGIPLDADGDGDMDIFRVNAWGGMSGYFTMTVLLNQGGGTFTQGWRLDFEHNPGFASGNIQYRLVAGDFDRDGDVDMATLLQYEYAAGTVNKGSLAVRWNDGSGKFAAASVLQSSGFRSDATLGAGDFDNDGDLDLVCSAQAHWGDDELWHPSTRLFDNNGSGVFTASTADWFWGTTPVDLNRDGWTELANAKYVSWNNQSGNVAGGFNGPHTWPESGAGVIAGLSVFADANGDGFMDIILGSAKSLVMRTGNGDGAWSQPVTLGELSSWVMQVGAADSDSDGDTDFMVLMDNGSFVFFENRSHHRAADAQPASSGTHPLAGVTQLQCADFNRDGLDDLLAVTPSQNKLWICYGEQDGVPAAPVFKNTQGAAPGGATVVDLDRDGRPDIAYTLPSSGAVRRAMNNGPAPFAWADEAIATGLTGVNLITTGQLGTANGRMDLLTSSASTGQLRWLYQSGNTWLGQNVLNSSSPAPRTILTRNVAAGPGDEPFCLGTAGGSLRVRGFQLKGPWTGMCDLQHPVTASPHSPVMAWGKLHGDGVDKLVFVHGNGQLVYWVPGAAGAFGIGAAPSAIRALETVDWNRDGRDDILCATAGGISLFTWKNGWQREDLHSVSGGFTAIKVMDLNRDGFPDLAAATGTHVHFLKNAPRVLRATVSGAAETVIAAGQSASVLTVSATHQGRSGEPGTTWLADEEAALTGATLRFSRAVPNGSGQWKPGPALSKTELGQLLLSARLTVDSKVIGAAGPAALEDDGTVAINYNAVLGNLIPVAGGDTQHLGIRLTLTATAAQASNNRFYVSMISSRGRVLDSAAADETVPVMEGSGFTALVTVKPDHTPLQQWRLTHFGNPAGTEDRANEADFDRDGVPNLLEYAVGTDPAKNEPALNTANALAMLPLGNAQAPVKCRVTLAIEAMADSHVRLTVQAATGLNNWTSLASRTGGGAWTGLNPDFSVPSGGVTAHILTTAYTPQNTKRLFLRLLAEEIP